jgi:hypothetical protein
VVDDDPVFTLGLFEGAKVGRLAESAVYAGGEVCAGGVGADVERVGSGADDGVAGFLALLLMLGRRW